jgi:hypothetical protein
VLITKYYSGDQIERNEVGEACSTYGKRRGVYRILLGRPEGRGPLGRRTYREEDNIKMDISNLGWGMD